MQPLARLSILGFSGLLNLLIDSLDQPPAIDDREVVEVLPGSHPEVVTESEEGLKDNLGSIFRS